MKTLTMLLALVVGIGEVDAAEYDITRFGATPNDSTDDTTAIKDALAECGKARGGKVLVPAGTFIVSRQASEACILEVPTNTTVQGVGTASILKFPDRVNETNFWRMIRSYRAVRNVTIRDLALDGSNTLTKYEPGTTFEQNHGIWFYAKDGVSTNITIDNVYSHHFSGDCIALGRGSVASVIRNCAFHDGLRCGIQVGVHDGGSNIQVLNNRELPNVLIEGNPRGLHLEHNEGVSKVLVSGNYARQSHTHYRNHYGRSENIVVKIPLED